MPFWVLVTRPGGSPTLIDECYYLKEAADNKAEDLERKSLEHKDGEGCSADVYETKTNNLAKAKQIIKKRVIDREGIQASSRNFKHGR